MPTVKQIAANRANNSMLDLLVCGMSNGAVSPCPDFVP